MNFGKAIDWLKQGERVSRQGWNGKGMYLVLMKSDGMEVDGFPLKDCIAMKTQSDEMQPGWLASQADMLATDWFILASNSESHPDTECLGAGCACTPEDRICKP